jgi:threonine dehydrogenase-like Zn-dependent dehydrogenase
MKAVVYDHSRTGRRLTRALGRFDGGSYLGKYSCIQLADVPEPEIRNPHWVKIKTRMSCVSDSDLAVIVQKESGALSSFATFPFVFGRNNHGVVSEVGDAVKGFRPGDRVVVDPALNCRARDIEPECESCENGNTSACENIAEGSLSPGISIGCCCDTGGGWSAAFIAHENQLHGIPPEVDDDSAATIVTFGAALHAVMRNFPGDGETVLIYGCGAAGLCATAALRALGSGCTIVAVDASRFHGGMALRLGADRVIYPGDLKRPIAREVAGITGAQCYKTLDGDEILMGGCNKIFDTIASARTINQGLRLAANGAAIVLTGAAAAGTLDPAPIALKNISIRGSLGCGIETYQGRKAHTFSIAADLLNRRAVNLKPLITHKFRLDDYKKAIEVNLHKEKHSAIETAFTFDI